MAETLQIVIDVGDAEAKLKAVAADFKALGEAVGKLDGKSGNALNKIVEALNKLKPLDTSLVSGVSALGSAMNALQPTHLGETVSALNRLGKVDVALVAANIKALAAALSEVKIPPGLDSMANALRNLSGAATQTTTAVRGLHGGMGPTTGAINSLTRELTNAVGFMGGFGTTVGNMIAPLTRLATEFKTSGEAVNAFGAHFAGLGRIAASIGPLGIAVGALAAATLLLGPSVIKATTAYQQFVLAVDAVKGKGAGAVEFEKVREIAARTGQSVGALADSYSKFMIASNAAGQSTEQTRKIFEGFSTGLRVMGSTTEQTKKAFLALTQMMSKGTVGAEELRQQLGDAMPIAMQAFAKAAGVSEKQLMKMMESGQVISKDILPKVAAQLKETFGGSLAAALQQPQAAIERFGNAIQELLRNMGGGNFGGLAAGFAAGLNAINKALESPALAMFARLLGDLMGVLTGGILGAIGGLVQGLTFFIDIMARIASIFSPILTGFNSLVSVLTGGSTAVGTFANAVTLLATGLGMIGGAIIAYYTAIGVATVATAAWTVAMGVLSAAWAAAAGSVALLGTAIAAVGWPIALVLAFGVALVALAAYLDTTSSATDQFNQKITAQSTVVQSNAAALREWMGQMRETPGDLMAAANAMNSFSEAQKQAKQEVTNLKAAQRELSHELKAMSLADKEAERGTRLYIDGLKRKKEALHEMEQSLKRAQENMKGFGSASKNAAGGAGMYAEQIRSLHRQQENLDNAMKRASIALDVDKQKRQEASDAIRLQAEKMQLLQERYNEYKVVLSDVQVKEVQRLEALGMAKEKAAEMVSVTGLLTRSITEQAAEAGNTASKHIGLAAAINENIKAIQAAMEKEKERLTVSKEDKAISDIRLQSFTQQIEKLQQLAAEEIKAAATARAIQIAFSENVSSAEALDRAYGEIAKTLGLTLDEAQKMAEEFKRVDANALESSKILEGLGKSAKAAFDSMVVGIRDSIKWLRENTQWIRDMFDAWDRWIGKTKAVTKQSADVTKGFNDTSIAARNAALGLDQYGNKLEDIAKKGRGIGDGPATGFQKTGQAATEAGGRLNWLGERIQKVKSGYGQTISVIPPVNDAMTGTGRAAEAAGGKLNWLGERINTVKSGYGTVISVLPPVNAALDAQGRAAEAAGGKLTHLGERVNTLKSGYGTVISIIPPVNDAIRGSGQAAGDAATKMGPAAEHLQRLRQGYTDLGTAIPNATNAQRIDNGVSQESVAKKQEEIKAIENKIISNNKNIGTMKQSLDALNNEAGALSMLTQKNKDYIGIDGQRHNGEVTRLSITNQLTDAMKAEIAALESKISAASGAGEADAKRLESMRAELNMLNAGSDPMRQRIAALQNERAVVGESVNQLIARRNGLQELLHAEKNAGNANAETIAGLQAKLDKTNEMISADQAYQGKLDSIKTALAAEAAELQTTEGKARVAAEAMALFVGANDKAGISAQTLGTNLGAAKTGFEAMDAAEKSLIDSAPAVIEGFNTITTGANQLRSTLDQPVGDQFSSSLNGMVDDFGGYNGAVRQASEGTSRLFKEVQNADGSFSTMGTAVGRTDGKVDEFGDETVTAATSTRDAANAMQEASNAAQQLASSYQQAAAAARELAAAQRELDGAGGGGDDKDTGREGGRVGELLGRQRVPFGTFDNAPELAGGITNTSKLSSKVSGGGIPSILHPGEAVVPLSRGRNIPVDLSMKTISAISQPQSSGPDLRIVSNAIESFSHRITDTLDELNDTMTNIGTGGTTNTVADVGLGGSHGGGGSGEGSGGGRSGGMGAGDDEHRLPRHAVERVLHPPEGGGEASTSNGTGGRMSGDGAPARRSRGNTVINNNTFNIPPDLIGRTPDQIAKAIADRLRRANSRNG